MFKKEQLLDFVEFHESSSAGEASLTCAKALVEDWEQDADDKRSDELLENIDKAIAKLRHWKLYVERQAKQPPSQPLRKDLSSVNNWSEEYPLVHIFFSSRPITITGNSYGLVSLATAMLDAISEIRQGRTQLMQSDGLTFEVVVTREDSDTTWESISSP